MDTELLRNISIFADIGKRDLDTLAKYARRRHFSRAAILLDYGEIGQVAYVILSGTVKVHRSISSGVEVTLAVRGRGECVGELSIIDNCVVSATVTAMTALETVEFSSDSLRKAIRASPSLSWSLIKSLTRRLREASDVIEAMATKKLASRLAGVIASIAEQHGVPCRGEDRLEILGAIKIDIPLTILDLASIVGNSREPVNRALTTMRKSGLVVRDRRDRKLVVNDIERLRRL